MRFLNQINSYISLHYILSTTYFTTLNLVIFVKIVKKKFNIFVAPAECDIKHPEQTGAKPERNVKTETTGVFPNNLNFKTFHFFYISKLLQTQVSNKYFLLHRQ